jgi:hypothetical protein
LGIPFALWCLQCHDNGSDFFSFVNFWWLL